jgi:fluoroquinolone transport system permease protein
MRQTIKLLQIGIRQIKRDGMLLVLLPAPFLIGLIFKFAIPLANQIFEDMLSFSLIPWYRLVDGLLMCLTPMLMAMLSAFLLLEERDEGIGAFYQITPTEGYAYLMARIGFPMVYSLLVTGFVAAFFNISGLSIGTIVCSSFISTLMGSALAMMIVSIAGNRVEGLAISKLTGVSLLGLVVVWFIPAPYMLCAAFLPSFWIGKLMMESMNLFPFIMGLLFSCLWIVIFTRKYQKRS